MHSKISENKPLWNIYVKENYIDGKSVIFTCMHHTIGDGMSFFSLFTFMNDKPGSKTLPKIRKSSFNFAKYFSMILVPFYSTYAFTKFALLKKDKNCYNLRLRNNRQSGIKQILCTKKYDFSKLRQAYKQYPNTTFNDFIMGVLGVALKKYMDTNGSEKSKYVT